MKLAIFALFVTSLCLSGCGPLFNEVYFTSQRLQSRDWAPHGEAYTPKKVYCYKSLGGADCYDQEQPHRRNQLIEAYTQSPQEEPTPSTPILLRKDHP